MAGRKKLPFVCQQCGKPSEARADVVRANKVRFCSKKCAGAFASRIRKIPGVDVHCQQCGRWFRTKPRRIDWGGGKFCSKKCWALFQLGKPNYARQTKDVHY